MNLHKYPRSTEYLKEISNKLIQIYKIRNKSDCIRFTILRASYCKWPNCSVCRCIRSSPQKTGWRLYNRSESNSRLPRYKRAQR